MSKRVVAIFDAVQKVRKAPATLAGDGDFGHLQGMTAWGHGRRFRDVREESGLPPTPHKVVKYYDYPAWWVGSATQHLLINMDRWNALPRHYQAAVLAAARDASNWMTARYGAVNPLALKRFLAGGTQLRPCLQEIMEACYKAANEVYAQTAAANPRFKKINESLVAFRSASYLYWQVAKMSFDLLRVRMRTRA